ncbi:MAG: AraC family transcriptional regulator [Bacteroidales bacterium]|jgi:AraC family transcriptional regulator|nr:AraC family transcriptional regulator [Bacteroidales bacterium]
MSEQIKTEEVYQQRLKMVIEYIDRNIDRPINIAQLADVACFSRYHFIRIMSAALGESIWSYIIRRRVETAAILLRETDLSIMDIAEKVGYDIPSSFTKVFRSFYNVSPLEYRNNKTIKNMKSVKVSETIDLKAPKIVVLEPKRVIYMEFFGNYSEVNYGYAFETLWKQVKKQCLYGKGIEHLSLCMNDPEVTLEKDLVTHVCLSVPKPAKAAEEVKVRTLEGGKFAKFNYVGSYDHFSAVYNAIFGKWLQESGFTLRESPCMEKYVSDTRRVPPEKCKTEIYIPIE